MSILLRYLMKSVNCSDEIVDTLQTEAGRVGSTVVECLTRDRGATVSSLTGDTVLCP